MNLHDIEYYTLCVYFNANANVDRAILVFRNAHRVVYVVSSLFYETQRIRVPSIIVIILLVMTLDGRRLVVIACVMCSLVFGSIYSLLRVRLFVCRKN